MELLGIFLPPIIDLVNKFIKDTTVRFLISLLFCAAVGAGLNWLATGWSFQSAIQAYQSISESILAVVGAAQISYKAVYSQSALQKAIDFRVETGAR